MSRRIFIAALAAIVAINPVQAQRATQQGSDPTEEQSKSRTTKEILTDVAIATLIIAASVAAYKAMGRPCACPDDTMSNGRRCGGNSAYLKPNGYKPLCNPTDITATMISTYRTSKTVPNLR